MFSTIFNWLVKSSADPRKVSLAVRGTFLLFGSQLVRVFDTICSFGLKCVGVDSTLINTLADGVEGVVYAFLLLWGAVWFLYGLGRKLYLGRWSHPDAV